MSPLAGKPSRGMQPWRTQDDTLGRVRKIWAVWLLHLPPWAAQSTHRVAMATFWRTFHQEGKISPAWWGEVARPLPFTISTITSKVVVYSAWEGRYNLPISTLPLYVLCGADALPLFPLYPYMYSVGQIHSPCFYSTPICTLWGRYTPPVSTLPLYVLCGIHYKSYNSGHQTR